MSGTFKVGEIAVYCRPGPYHGLEVTVIKGLHRSRLWNLAGTDYEVTEVYSVDGPFPGQPRHGSWATKPEYLRKRRPPQDWVKLCRLDEVPNAIDVARKALA